MAHNVQLPSTIHFMKCDATETPRWGGIQRSDYAFIQRVSGITNPACLQRDILYPNAIAALRESDANNEQPHISSDKVSAEGCRGHQIDNAFPLESRTPFALPFVMYPSNTDGTMLHEIDLCSEPVLNWEGYMMDIKCNVNCREHMEKIVDSEDLTKKSSETENNPNLSDSEESFHSEAEEVPSSSSATCTATQKSVMKTTEGGCKSRLRSVLIASENHGSAEVYPEDRKKRAKEIQAKFKKYLNKQTDTNAASEPVLGANTERSRIQNLEIAKLPPVQKTKQMTRSSWLKLKNIPSFRVEGTWNYFYGGFNGACCYVNRKNVQKNYLFTGKGSQLRALQIEKANRPSIFSYGLKSIWEEVPRSAPFNVFAKDKSPLDDLIFQIISNEFSDLLAVRRGKSIQIYSIDEETPHIIETVPNIYYGTSRACPVVSKRNTIIQDPLLAGVDFNPKYDPEIVTIDENGVIRLCDICDEETVSMYMVDKDMVKQRHITNRPEGYPIFTLNEAAGITYTNYGHLFLGWKDSLITLYDRREFAGASTVLDLRNEVSLRSLSDQNYFHHKDNPARLNEYISCVRRSRVDDTYYYVGTSSKMYMMDLRVPNRPVFLVSHGLQSPLAYIDSYSDENYDMIVGGCQRLSETFCMITDRTHTNCIDRPACKSESPVLYCYPKHLTNSRAYFDGVCKEGYDFHLPADYEMVKNHCCAWSTGLSVLPPCSIMKNLKVPSGFVVATSNNFGDVFLQEWDQKPSNRKMCISDMKLRKFIGGWKTAMTPTLSKLAKPKPSKNKYEPMDVSIFLEPLAREIEKLPRVRSTRFNSFRPGALQHHDNLRTLVPMKDLVQKLKGYKNEKVQGILNVWTEEDKDNTTTENVDANLVDLAEIKIEPDDEIDGSLSTSLHTINIDVSEQGESEILDDNFFEFSQSFDPDLPSPVAVEYVLEEEEKVVDEFSVQRSLSEMKDETNSEDMFRFQQHFGYEDNMAAEANSQSQLSQEELFFENSQDFLNLPSTSSQTFGSQSQYSQSQDRKKPMKRRKSGFL